MAAATETIELLQQDQVVRRDQILDLVEKAAAVSTELEEAKAELKASHVKIVELAAAIDSLVENFSEWIRNRRRCKRKRRLRWQQRWCRGGAKSRRRQ